MSAETAEELWYAFMAICFSVGIPGCLVAFQLLWQRWKADRCPTCYGRFSDWFTWEPFGRYCYPCYDKHKRLVTESGEVKEPKP